MRGYCFFPKLLSETPMFTAVMKLCWKLESYKSQVSATIPPSKKKKNFRKPWLVTHHFSQLISFVLLGCSRDWTPKASAEWWDPTWGDFWRYNGRVDGGEQKGNEWRVSYGDSFWPCIQVTVYVTLKRLRSVSVWSIFIFENDGLNGVDGMPSFKMVRPEKTYST